MPAEDPKAEDQPQDLHPWRNKTQNRAVAGLRLSLCPQSIPKKSHWKPPSQQHCVGSHPQAFHKALWSSADSIPWGRFAQSPSHSRSIPQLSLSLPNLSAL